MPCYARGGGLKNVRTAHSQECKKKLIQERMKKVQNEYHVDLTQKETAQNLLADAAKDLIFAGFAKNDAEANYHIASAVARLLIWLNDDY